MSKVTVTTVRDAAGRDARIHGLVFNDAAPILTLRELLRQWSESGCTPPGDLAKRTEIVLGLVDQNGEVSA